jgi:hypothetical protein
MDIPLGYVPWIHPNEIHMDIPLGYITWIHPNEIRIQSSSLAYLLEQ